MDPRRAELLPRHPARGRAWHPQNLGQPPGREGRPVGSERGAARARESARRGQSPAHRDLMIKAHTDVVGSLLRPPDLLQARKDREAGTISAAQFKAIEDAAVEAAVKLQEDAGIDVVTDGEMRRLSFQSALTEAVDGFGDVPLDAFLWGECHSDVLGEMDIERPPDLGVTAKLHRRRHLAAE